MLFHQDTIESLTSAETAACHTASPHCFPTLLTSSGPLHPLCEQFGAVCGTALMLPVLIQGWRPKAQYQSCFTSVREVESAKWKPRCYFLQQLEPEGQLRSCPTPRQGWSRTSAVSGFHVLSLFQEHSPAHSRSDGLSCWLPVELCWLVSHRHLVMSNLNTQMIEQKEESLSN